jgi:hypothetical protein
VKVNKPNRAFINLAVAEVEARGRLNDSFARTIPSDLLKFNTPKEPYELVEEWLKANYPDYETMTDEQLVDLIIKYY